MGIVLSPSMMCADFGNISQEICELEKAGANRLHLDVMDGQFVPNFALGYCDIKAICRKTKLKTELHLMIEQPSKYIDLFAQAGVNIIYIHPESDYHPATAIQEIVEAGSEPGIALSPGTSIEMVSELLPIINHVLVMGVNPGHAGQIYMPYVDKKIDKLLSVKNMYNFEIILDGACSPERIKKWAAIGVDGFVLGTAALFGKGKAYSDIIESLA